MEDSEETIDCYASRLRILAVRYLGYTHTEAGERTVRRIAEELGISMNDGRKQAQSDADTLINEEVI